jgi:Fe-S cluster assembly protein SufD
MNRPDVFRSHFESLNGAVPAWVKRLRSAGMERFAALGFPTTRLEDWKYTDVARIADTAFRMPAANLAGPAAELARHLACDGAPRLVFVNGRYSETLSATHGLPAGAQTLPLSRAFEGHHVERHLASLADIERESFTALNTAFLNDGAYIHLARGTTVEQPIHVLFLSLPAADAVASHPRVLIVGEPGSAAVVVEDYAGRETYLTNSVTEIVVGENAGIDHYRLQREGADGFHVGTVEVRQARDSRLHSYAISLGAALARIAVSTRLEAEGGECVFDGLYMAKDRQHVDHHTSIDHRRPRCSSRELYKGVLDGKSTGVFSGKVFVRPDAQKSDAQQMNNNLLLSDDAVVDTKPQLEIFADDVKCSHGATIGRLDDDALFYFRSRGIDAKTARDLLIRGFAHQLLDRMSSDAVRAQVEKSLEERWGWAPQTEVLA